MRTQPFIKANIARIVLAAWYVAFTTGSSAAANSLSDGQIIGIYIQVSSFDIETALLGRAQATSESVRNMANRVAGNEGEGEFGRSRRKRRRGAGAADRAEDTVGACAGVELKPIPALGLESLRFHMNGVRPFRARDGGSLPDQLAHTLVGGDAPADPHLFRRHAAAVEGLGREARPQHYAVRPRVARRNAEFERIAGEPRVSAKGHGGRSQQDSSRL
jgi:hypothetical protein